MNGFKKFSCLGNWDSCFDPILSGFVITCANHTAFISSPRIDADDNGFATKSGIQVLFALSVEIVKINVQDNSSGQTSSSLLTHRE